MSDQFPCPSDPPEFLKRLADTRKRMHELELYHDLLVDFVTDSTAIADPMSPEPNPEVSKVAMK